MILEVIYLNSKKKLILLAISTLILVTVVFLFIRHKLATVERDLLSSHQELERLKQEYSAIESEYTTLIQSISELDGLWLSDSDIYVLKQKRQRLVTLNRVIKDFENKNHDFCATYSDYKLDIDLLFQLEGAVQKVIKLNNLHGDFINSITRIANFDNEVPVDSVRIVFDEEIIEPRTIKDSDILSCEFSIYPDRQTLHRIIDLQSEILEVSLELDELNEKLMEKMKFQIISSSVVTASGSQTRSELYVLKSKLDEVLQKTLSRIDENKKKYDNIINLSFFSKTEILNNNKSKQLGMYNYGIENDLSIRQVFYQELCKAQANLDMFDFDKPIMKNGILVTYAELNDEALVIKNASESIFPEHHEVVKSYLKLGTKLSRNWKEIIAVQSTISNISYKNYTVSMPIPQQRYRSKMSFEQKKAEMAVMIKYMNEILVLIDKQVSRLKFNSEYKLLALTIADSYSLIDSISDGFKKIAENYRLINRDKDNVVKLTEMIVKLDSNLKESILARSSNVGSELLLKIEKLNLDFDSVKKEFTVMRQSSDTAED
jgi:hypothetical protein